jgi:hypothetical protein
MVLPVLMGTASPRPLRKSGSTILQINVLMWDASLMPPVPGLSGRVSLQLVPEAEERRYAKSSFKMRDSLSQ